TVKMADRQDERPNERIPRVSCVRSTEVGVVLIRRLYPALIYSVTGAMHPIDALCQLKALVKREALRKRTLLVCSRRSTRLETELAVFNPSGARKSNEPAQLSS